jgi:hypothetical protein
MSGEKRARALQAYKAQTSDELSFAAGDIIKITGDCEILIFDLFWMLCFCLN